MYEAGKVDSTRLLVRKNEGSQECAVKCSAQVALRRRKAHQRLLVGVEKTYRGSFSSRRHTALPVQEHGG